MADTRVETRNRKFGTNIRNFFKNISIALTESDTQEDEQLAKEVEELEAVEKQLKKNNDFTSNIKDDFVPKVDAKMARPRKSTAKKKVKEEMNKEEERA